MDDDLTLECLVHDLNNVFQTISDAAEVVGRDVGGKSVSEGLHRSVDRGRRILHSILERHRTTTDLTITVPSAVQFTRDYLQAVHAPQIDISTNVEPGVVVNGHPGSWERVLVNLLVNAAEAGATKADITARPGEITVSDNGPGIAPDLLPLIFHPHVSTKPITSGLGLYAVESIVKQHGGRVSVENLPEGGAVFRISL